MDDQSARNYTSAGVFVYPDFQQVSSTFAYVGTNEQFLVLWGDFSLCKYLWFPTAWVSSLWRYPTRRHSFRDTIQELLYVPGGGTEFAFRSGSVCQLVQPDVSRDLYGVSGYLSALLNEAAPLFRRRYCLDGSHAGFIMPAIGDFAEGDLDKMKEVPGIFDLG